MHNNLRMLVVQCKVIILIIITWLEIISGESLDTMTGQNHFSSVMYHFWPVKLRQGPMNQNWHYVFPKKLLLRAYSTLKHSL